MNIKNLLCAIFLLMLTFSCNLSRSIPNMPNVSKKLLSIKSNVNADYVGLIPFNDVIIVTLNSKAKEYKFYGISGKQVKIKQKSIENQNCYLQLFDANGIILETNSSTSGLAEITFTLTSTGMHSVSIGSDSSANATGTYQVSINADEGVSHPVVAILPNDYLWDLQGYPTTQLHRGDYVVAWQKYSSMTGWDIYARLYNSNGTPKGAEFLVNGTTEGDQIHPSIAINPTGYFVIAWEGRGNVNGQLDDDTGIYMQRFYPHATRYYPGYELRANYYTSGVSSNPSIVVGEDFSTAVTWETHGSSSGTDGIWLGRFGYDSLGLETKINESTTGNNTNPKSSKNNAGEIAVTWQNSTNNNNFDIYYRRYNLYDTNYSTPQTQVNSFLTGVQSNPDIVITDDNRIAVTWQKNGSLTDDGVYLKYLNIPNNNSPEIKINTTISNDLSYPSISMNLANGIHKNDFIITWMGGGLGDDTGIFRRKFNILSLNPIDSEYRSNLLTNGVQEKPLVVLGVNTESDLGLSGTDLNYSKFITIWKTRNTSNNNDGLYLTMIRSNNQNIYNEFRVDQKENNGSEPAGIIPFNDVITVAYHDGFDSGFISKPKEYKFYGASGQQVRIKQKGLTSNDCYLQLFNPNGVLVSENKNSTGLASINSTLNMSGMWSIKVATDGYINSNQTPNGIYQVSINADEGVSHPVVAILPNDYLWDLQGYPTTQLHRGDYVVAWQKYSSMTGWDIYARLYNSNGTPKGAEFLVNGTTEGDQIHPSIAINPTGYFVIAWEGRGNVNGQLDDDTGIYMQRFYPHATRYYPGYELRANYYTSGVSSNPSIVVGEDFSTAVTWETHGSSSGTDGIWLGRFGYDSLGLETRVNGVLTGTNTNPKANMNNAGEIAVAWQSSSGNDNYDIHYKRYNINDVNYSTQETQANYYVNGIQSNPDIVITDDNKIAITWQTNGSLIGLDGIYVRLLNIPNYSDTEFKINTTLSNDLSYPSISLNTKNGLYKNDFLVTWMGTGTGDTTGIYSRKYNIISGYPQTGEIKLNSLLNGSQEKPVVAFNLNTENDANLLQSITSPLFSRFITVWQTRNSTDNTNGIYALRSINSYATVENEIKVNANTAITGGASND